MRRGITVGAGVCHELLADVFEQSGSIAGVAAIGDCDQLPAVCFEHKIAVEPMMSLRQFLGPGSLEHALPNLGQPFGDFGIEPPLRVMNGFGRSYFSIIFSE